MSKKRSIWTWLGLGTLIALLGGGLFAATTDAITSQDNTGQTNAYTPPEEGVDIKGAVVGDASLCNANDTPPATMTDGPLPAIVTGTWDLNTSSPVIQSDTVCLYNAGTEDGTAIADVSAPNAVEVGACEVDESAAGDQSCSDGDAGELFAGFGAEISQCTIDPQNFRFVIPAGGYCDYQYEAVPRFLDASGATTSDPTLAQTDLVTYDLNWSLEAPCTDPTGDTQETATPQSHPLALSTVEICDTDWYEISGLTGGAGHQLDLIFTHSPSADIDVTVFDDTGNSTLGSGTSVTDNETVTFTSPPSGTVLVRIVIIGGDTSVYDITTTST